MKKNQPLKTLLHKHLAFFSDFIELTETKKVQIRITSEKEAILVEIFSFNGVTKELVERKYYEFVDYTLNDDKDLNGKVNFSSDLDQVSRIKNEAQIAFEKGMFIGEKNHIEELKQEKFEWQKLAKDLVDLSSSLAQKLPDQVQSNNQIINNFQK